MPAIFANPWCTTGLLVIMVDRESSAVIEVHCSYRRYRDNFTAELEKYAHGIANSDSKETPQLQLR
jgi:hypothetical protein